MREALNAVGAEVMMLEVAGVVKEGDAAAVKIGGAGVVEAGGAAAVKAEAESALVTRTIALSLRFCRDTTMHQIQRALHLKTACTSRVLHLQQIFALTLSLCGWHFSNAFAPLHTER
jgi:hypothetical protein